MGFISADQALAVAGGVFTASAGSPVMVHRLLSTEHSGSVGATRRLSCLVTCRTLFLWPGIEPVPLSLKADS